MKYPHPVYGWKPPALYEHLSLEQLNELRVAVESDPASANRSGDIHLHTKAARKKLDALAWAVTYHLQDKQRSAA